MTIITQTDNLKQTKYHEQDYKELLEVGEYWEQVLVDWFVANGIEASRYRQDLSMLTKYSPLFSQFQRDIYLVHPKTGKRLNIEVKSRNSPWQYHSILVGKCSSWDVKKYPVKYLVVIDQLTGDARITKASKMVRQAEWVRNKNIDLSYSVQRKLFAPLEVFLDFLKNS